MAKQTNPNLNNLVIYELSVQNLTDQGDFDGVIGDLE